MKGLLLLSAGIDSPVAGYLMQKKAEVIAIHFDNQPLINKLTLEKVKKLVKKLNIKKLIIIPHGKNQIEIIKNCERKYQCVLCRRIMFKIAEKIAKQENCDFLITGENLGQVASQTLENMYVTEQAIQMKILRPILCNDKQETINIAKKIGTYDISIEAGMCCTAVPKNPVTKAHLNKVLEQEKKIKKLVK